MERIASKIYLLLTIIYITQVLVCCVCLNKTIGDSEFYITAAGLPFPFALMLLDIVAEVYGYKNARMLIWLGFFSLLLFAFTCNFLIHLPSPNGISNDSSFFDVFKNTNRAAITWVLAGFFADFINAYVITKWKILLKGRYFWLRSVGATVIGQTIYSLINVVILLSASYNSPPGFIHVMFVIFIYKMSMIALLAVPGTFLANFLKRVEKTDVYDYKTNFNPFKLQ